MKKYKKIQNKNNQRKKQLRTENKEAYQNIILYLRGANINIYQQELIRQDLLDLVLDGQLRDESIEDILGEDLRSVADEIISSVPKMTNIERFLEAISLFLRITLVLGAVKVGFSILNWLTINNGEPVVEVGLADIFLYIFIGIVSVFIVYKIVDDSLNESDQFTKQPKFFMTVTAVINSILMVIFIFLSFKFNPIIFSTSITFFIMGLLTLFLTMYALDKYIDVTYHN